MNKLLDKLPTIPQAGQWRTAMNRMLPVAITGRVRALRGNTIVAAGFPVPVGALCNIHLRQGSVLCAEVIGFDGHTTLLSPLAPMDGVSQGDPVHLSRTLRTVSVCPELIGRVLDASGNPIDDGPPIPPGNRVPCDAPPIQALDRPPIDQILPTQVRAMDAFLTLGRGQRVGVFAGSGVGKSTLLGMLARGTQADVVVIALVGERGREVREFLERDLGPVGRKRSVTVVATSDQPAPQRIQAAKTATAIAESFRDSGKNVLLLMDSVTRFAMAQREIGLAAGEVPTTRGYPPSVFSMLPQLVERTGRSRQGSITGIYTVLVEGDDPNEPISDALRGLLDGHIHLSRSIAARGRYPAIDVLPSLSRLQNQLVPTNHLNAATTVRTWMANYRENEDLITIGAYAKGSSPQVDRAIQMRPMIEEFLAQPTDTLIPWKKTQEALLAFVAGG